MVKGGLLTTHTGGDHGGGEAFEGQSSLRQGAVTGSSGDPDIGIVVAAAEQKVFSRDGGLFVGFRDEG